MTKKDYELAADLIRAMGPSEDDQVAADKLRELGGFDVTAARLAAGPTAHLAEVFADFFSRDNPRFDRARFIHAVTTGELTRPSRHTTSRRARA